MRIGGCCALGLLALVLAGCAAGKEQDESIVGQAKQLMLTQADTEREVEGLRCRIQMEFAKSQWMRIERTQPLWIDHRDEDIGTIRAFFRADRPREIAAVVACQGPNRSIYRFWTHGDEDIEEQALLMMLRPPNSEKAVGRQYCHMLMGQTKSKWMWAQRMQPLWIAYGPEGDATIGALFLKNRPDQVAAVVACEGPERRVYRFWER